MVINSRTTRRAKHLTQLWWAFFIFTSVALGLRRRGHARTSRVGLTLFTYAYAEGLGNGGAIDRSNLDFFLRVALSANTPGMLDGEGKVEYNIVVNGRVCTPCDITLPVVLRSSSSPGMASRVRVFRRENTGMDMGAHNFSLSWAMSSKPDAFTYFIFINSSFRGPFMPKWTPANFHFTDTLLSPMKLRGVKLMGAYLSCLNRHVEPVSGPIIETGFFALDRDSLLWAIQDGIFQIYESKAETIVKSEYGVAKSILSRGGDIDTLLTRYKPGVEWSNPKHQFCNDNRHSSRRGALSGGISVNIFETVFVKLSWCVRAKEVEVTSNWILNLAQGRTGTEGNFDRIGWEKGVSPEGTSGKAGTLPIEVPTDGCATGDVSALLHEGMGFR